MSCFNTPNLSAAASVKAENKQQTTNNKQQSTINNQRSTIDD